MSESVQMPPKVATAINAVMASIERLGKGETNKHGGYKFASVDAFYDAVRPLMAESGLIISADEEGFEVLTTGSEDRPTHWLKMQFVFTLAHISGETWAERPKRSIMVNAAMGAQAFGAAQSYADKQYLRSLFKISTGDPDADSHEQSNLPQARSESKRDLGPSPEGKDWWGCEGLPNITANQAKKDGLDKTHEDFRAEIAAIPTASAWRDWGAEHSDEIKRMPKAWRIILRAEFEERGDELAVDRNGSRQ